MAVTLAFSQSLFLSLEEGPVEIEATGLGVEITTHFFPLSTGLVLFPFPNIFPWLNEDFNVKGFVLVLVVIAFMGGCDVTGE